MNDPDLLRRKAAPEHSMNPSEPDTASVAAADYESIELFGARTEITIRHDGSIYRLRVTRQGKLLLNK